MDDQPIATSLVRLIASWGFVARPVYQAEQLPVKLRESAGVRSIQDHLAKQRRRPRVFHELTSEEFSPAHRWADCLPCHSRATRAATIAPANSNSVPSSAAAA